jgi:hypothetical protein
LTSGHSIHAEFMPKKAGPAPEVRSKIHRLHRGWKGAWLMEAGRGFRRDAKLDAASLGGRGPGDFD